VATALLDANDRGRAAAAAACGRNVGGGVRHAGMGKTQLDEAIARQRRRLQLVERAYNRGRSTWRVLGSIW